MAAPRKRYIRLARRRKGASSFFFLPDKGPPLARTSTQQAGRACPLCPGTSDVNLLRCRDRVIDLNTQTTDGALDLCVAEQELDGPKIACAPIDQRCLRPPEGMGAENLRIKSGSGDPFRDKPRVLACRHAAALVAAAQGVDVGPLICLVALDATAITFRVITSPASTVPSPIPC
jgi:hypothetical protein